MFTSTDAHPTPESSWLSWTFLNVFDFSTSVTSVYPFYVPPRGERLFSDVWNWFITNQ